jgi:hypothetical protein
MLDKLKMIENMAENFDELMEFKKAFLAYEMGLYSNSITLEQIDALDVAIEYYYDQDDISFFTDERIVDAFDACFESE